MCYVSYSLEVDVFYFLLLPQTTSVGIKTLTYSGLVANV